MKVPIVDEDDNIIEYKERDELLLTDRNRDANLFVFNEKNEILLSKRSANKKLFPNRWGMAVSGTVEEGETYESNIIKEAREEIGLVDIQPTFLYKSLKNKEVKRMGAVFKLNIASNYNFILEPNEVSEVKWFTRQDLEKLLATNKGIFTPNFPDYYARFKEYENKI